MFRYSFVSADLFTWLFCRGYLGLAAWCGFSTLLKTLWRPLDVCSWLVCFGDGVLSPWHNSISVLFSYMSWIVCNREIVYWCDCTPILNGWVSVLIPNEHDKPFVKLVFFPWERHYPTDFYRFPKHYSTVEYRCFFTLFYTYNGLFLLTEVWWILVELL